MVRLRIAHGAPADILDLSVAQADRTDLCAHERPQIAVRLRIPFSDHHARAGRGSAFERLGDLFTDLEAARAYRRANRSVGDGADCAELARGFEYDARTRAAPARMHGRDAVRALAREQDGAAVGSLHGDGRAVACDESVRAERALVGRRRIHHDVRAVHLDSEADARAVDAQSREETKPSLFVGRVGREARTKIQARARPSQLRAPRKRVRKSSAGQKVAELPSGALWPPDICRASGHQI